MIKVYVPRDTTACALGADQVADALVREAAARKTEIELIRNGSRGMFWLEPLVEVDTPAGRVGYGPVGATDVVSLFDGGFLDGGQCELGVGLVAEIPYLKKQQRVNFARAGIIDPLSVEDYRAHGGYAGLERALTMTPQAIVDEIKNSGLRGRGGAAFPAGIKWQTVLDTGAEQKYVVCNADEGDSGTFADRLLMEADPFQLIEGMAIAGLATGATQGYIYLRSEYPMAHTVLKKAIANGDWRLAIRLKYLQTLKLLSDEHLIEWEPYKTNHEYGNEIGSGDLRLKFERISHYFDYAWYGEFQVNEKHFDRVREIFTEMRSGI